MDALEAYMTTRPQAKPGKTCDADKPCDIVLEGGAASGIVYPRAIAELSKSYRFQRIGGTSAGAVAAAATAAAELGRRSGNRASVDDLAKIPDWLADETKGHTRLRWLFEPENAMRPAYELFMALFPLSAGSAWRLIGRAARHFPLSFFGGAALGVLVGALALYGAFQIDGVARLPLALAAVGGGVLAAVVFALLLLLASLAFDVVCKLPRHHFGVSRGYSRTPARDPSPRVTNWMYELIQRLAGKPLTAPLTFGDLERCTDAMVGNDQGIVLRLMATCLNHGRPYRLPFADDEVFYYDPTELGEFFPPEVIRWLEKHPHSGAQEIDGYRALPRAEDFPVVIAVRLSMAFPLFFSSIPLYAVDHTQYPDLPDRARALVRAQARGRPPVERCWFADGGICSNLPVHFFDRPLPRWPTFALDLRECHRDLGEKSKVWIDHDFLDQKRRSIITEWWTRLKHEPSKVGASLGVGESAARAVSFLQTVFDTMMNWQENAQLRPAGSRDRVAHIGLYSEEGSFNLDMTPARIRALAERGAQGGRKLRDRFARDSGWTENRSIRLRSFLSVTGEFLQSVKIACDRPAAGDVSYVDALQDPKFRPTDGSVLAVEQRAVAANILEKVLTAAEVVPEDGSPGSLVTLVSPPRQTMRFLPEGEPFIRRELGSPHAAGDVLQRERYAAFTAAASSSTAAA
jgi:predicted acylesterase/phospholipase RssA